MTIGELWDKLAQYPDDMEIYIGFIDGHSIIQDDFKVVLTTHLDKTESISLMVEDINIINN
jgi:hypothetical protein